MGNTPEGRDFIRGAKDQGVKAAVTLRDAPSNDYSQAPKNRQPRKKSELGLQSPATARPLAGQSRPCRERRGSLSHRQAAMAVRRCTACPAACP